MASVSELISFARIKLDDTKEPYLWTDTELLVALQIAYDEFCEKTGAILDSSSDTYCSIPLLSNQNKYVMNDRVLKIKSAWLSTGEPLAIKQEDWFHGKAYAWRSANGVPRFVLPDYDAGFITVVPPYDASGEIQGNLTFNTSNKTITLASGGFSSRYAVGDKIRVTGTVNNNGYFTVSAVTDTQLTVVESLVNETIQAKIQKVMNTLKMTVIRLGAILTMTTPNLEINPKWHYKLVNGVLREAYAKQDTETYDPKAMERYATLFMKDIEEARGAVKAMRNYPRIYAPHRGTI